MSKYKTEFTKEELQSALHANEGKAEGIISSSDNWTKFKVKLEQFIKKARKVPVIGKFVDDIVAMIELVDAYIKGEYRDIPYSTIVSIVATLIYVISPIDIIPDVIPVIGYLDDAAIIAFALSLGIGNDLKKYREYQNGLRIAAIKQFEIAFSEEIKDTISEGYLASVVLSEYKVIKLFIVDSADCDKPFECKINVINAPISIFKNLDIENEEIVNVLTDIISLDTIKWANNATREVYLETEFEKVIDDYIFVED